MTMKRCALAILFLFPCLATAQTEPSIGEVTAGMEQEYGKIENASARFTQQVKFAFSELKQEFSGSLLMKKPNKYRLESEHQTLVTDGATVWAYSPVNKQVVVDRYKENRNSISPDRFLLNLPEAYYATVLGVEKSSGSRLVLLKLVPKDDRSFVKSVKLWVEEGTWVVQKILIVDVNETETTYAITDLKFNTPIKDTTFTFSPPPGTDVVDLR